MSIIQDYNEGKTQLNKLKFKPSMGSGHPGNPPLVTRDTPIEPANSPSPDLKSEIGRRADDLVRISKLMRRPEGSRFLDNNTKLNTAVDLSYVTTGETKDKKEALKDIAFGSALKDTLGTLASTLAQVPLAGTGTHFIKGKLFGRPNDSRNTVSPGIRGFGNPGGIKVKYPRDKYYEQKGGKIGVDEVNDQDVTFDRSVKNKDLIPFLFEVVKPGEQQNAFLHFRAYISDFSDSYNGNWNATQYIGRGEKFYTYGGFDRSISLNFKSAVASKQELKPVYKKLVYLASTTAPNYSTKDLMRGTYVRLTLGEYLADVPGIITSVSYSWNTSYPFEIALGKKDEQAPQVPRVNTDLTQAQQLPHVLDCSLTFIPIHTFTPVTGLKHFITNPEQSDSQFFEPSAPHSPEDGDFITLEELEERQIQGIRNITGISRGDLESGF